MESLPYLQALEVMINVPEIVVLFIHSMSNVYEFSATIAAFTLYRFTCNVPEILLDMYFNESEKKNVSSK